MILLTGATGYVGSLLLDLLLAKGHKVVCLARTPQKINARENLTILKADLEHTDILSDSKQVSLLKNVKIVIHLAALYDLKADHSSCYISNVVATMNLAVLVKKLPNFKKFIFMSTVAVAGDYDGVVPVDSVEFGQSFPNDYAKTKAQAEGFLRRTFAPDVLCILRAGIIIGNSKNLSEFKADGPYIAINYFKKLVQNFPLIKKFPFFALPMNSLSQLPVVPVDMVVNATIETIDMDLFGCYHLVIPDFPLIKDFTQDLLIALNIKARLKVLPLNSRILENFNRIPLPQSFPSELLGYMAIRPQYDLTLEKERFNSLNDVSWSEIKRDFFRQAIKNIN